MTLVAVFLIVFLGGPLLFGLFTKCAPSKGNMRMLVLIAILCAGAALVLRYGALVNWREDPLVVVAGIVLIWWGWIAILAVVTQVLRRADQGLAMRRATAILGAVGTTIPWFGLAIASYAIA